MLLDGAAAVGDAHFAAAPDVEVIEEPVDAFGHEMRVVARE